MGKVKRRFCCKTLSHAIPGRSFTDIICRISSMIIVYCHGSVWLYKCILSDNILLHFQSLAIRLNRKAESLGYLQAWKLPLYFPPTGKPSIISLQWLIPHLQMLSKFGQSFALQCFALGHSCWLLAATVCLACSHQVRFVQWFSPTAAYPPTIIVLWRTVALPAPEIGMHQKPAWSHQH